MKKQVLPLLGAAGMSVLCGCSIFNKSSQIVTITVYPADARLIVNGVEHHTFSPQIIEAIPSREMIITAYKPGYRERVYTVDYQLSSTGKIDAWASILLFPAIGLWTNGAWELKENNIMLKLDELTPEEIAEINRTTSSNLNLAKQKSAETAAQKAQEAEAKAKEAAAKAKEAEEHALDAEAKAQDAQERAKKAQDAMKLTEEPKAESVTPTEETKVESAKPAEEPQAEPAKSTEEPKAEPAKSAEEPKAEPAKSAEEPKAEPAKSTEPAPTADVPEKN